MSKPAAIIVLILLLCVVAGGSLVQAATIFTDDLAINSHVGEVANWSSGLPAAGNQGIIMDAFSATYTGEDDFDGINLIVADDAQVTGGTVKIDASNVTLFGNAVWNSAGEGLALGTDAAVDDVTRFTMYQNSILNLTDLIVGGGQTAWFRHYGGTVNIKGDLTINGAEKGASSRYDLLAGTLVYDGKLSINGSGRFNFPEDSIGTVNLVNSETSINDVKVLINAGVITIGSSAVSPSEFSIAKVEIDGKMYTTVSLVPEPSSIVLLLAFFGILLVGRRLRYILIR